MAAIDHRSPIPLWFQVSTALQRRIADGKYLVGGAVPTEQELASEFAVSRATVRQALGALETAGMVLRGRGRRTVVLPSAERAVRKRFRSSASDLFAEEEQTGVQSLTMAQGAPLSQRVADMLKLDAPVGTVIERIRTIQNRPFAYTVNYTSDEYGQLVTEEELWEQSLLGLLRAKGVDLARATYSIRADSAVDDIATALDLPVAAPVVFLERLIIDSRDVPIALAHGTYRGDTYEYTVDVDFRPKS